MLQSKDSDAAHSACREAPTHGAPTSVALPRTAVGLRSRHGGAVGKSVPRRTVRPRRSSDRTPAVPAGRCEELYYCWLRRGRCE